MSEKKYDVYSGNQKIGEVWGESAREAQIREEIKAENRARMLLKLADEFSDDEDAKYRNDLRRKLEKHKQEKDKLLTTLIITAIIAFISTVILDFGSLMSYILLINLFMGIRAVVNIPLIIAYIFFRKKSETCFFNLFKKQMTGEKISKILFIALLISICIACDYNIANTVVCWTAPFAIRYIFAKRAHSKAWKTLRSAENSACGIYN